MRVAGYFAASDAASETLFCAGVGFIVAGAVVGVIVATGGVSIPAASARR